MWSSQVCPTGYTGVPDAGITAVAHFLRIIAARVISKASRIQARNTAVQATCHYCQVPESCDDAADA